MDLSLLFCGTAGSAPTARRGLPALLVRRGGEQLLFDCGEGTQRQLLRAGGLPDLDAIFLTHFHADHWLGLPGLLKSLALRDREKPLEILGPPGTRKLLGEARFLFGRLPYALDVHELENGEDVDRDGYVVTAFNVRHRGTAFGYALVEDERPGRLDAQRAQELGVGFGPDLGRLQRGEVVNGVDPADVIGPPRAGRKIVYSGDTGPCEMLQIAAHRADLLVHEATFLHEDVARARETGHSTARQAAQVADEADVGMLALVHVTARHPPRALLEEARAIFEHTELPRDLDTVELPLPEKGSAELVRASTGGPPRAETSAASPS